MIADIILGLIILGFLIYMFWNTKETNKQTDRYMKALMSKNLQEYQAADIIQEKATIPDELPQQIEVEDLGDKGFAEHIKRILKQNG